MFEMATRAAKKPANQRPTVNVDGVVARLKESFLDDAAFGALIDDFRSQKILTKDAFAQVFFKLFERDRGIPKNASRDYIIRLIEDERFLLVKNAKMGADRKRLY